MSRLLAMLLVVLGFFGFPGLFPTPSPPGGTGPVAPTTEPSPSESPSTGPSEEDAVQTYIVMLRAPESLSETGGRQSEEGRAAVRAQVEAKATEWEGQGIEVTRTYPALGGLAARLTPERADEISKDPDVLSVSEDQVVSIPEPPTSSPT